MVVLNSLPVITNFIHEILHSLSKRNSLQKKKKKLYDELLRPSISSEITLHVYVRAVGKTTLVFIM